MNRQPLHADAAPTIADTGRSQPRATCTSIPTLGAVLQERIHAINLSRRQ